MTSSALTLWAPNLLLSERLAETSPQLAEVALPSLKTLLAKADKLPKDKAHQLNFQANACYLFHQKQTFPVAALTASIDLPAFDPSFFWLRVDPVQMIPDRDTLILIPGERLGVTDEESDALIQAFNKHFEQDCVVLEKGGRLRWYLRILQPIDIQTQSLDSVSFQSLQDALPKGNASSYWRQLINEVQMLFFTHPINEARREAGQPEINGVWVWGEGQYPEDIYSRPNAILAGKKPYLKGLAKAVHAIHQLPTENYPAWQILMAESNCTEQMLVLEDASQDLTVEEYLTLLEQFERDWFAPILQQLQSGTIHSLLLDLGLANRFYLTPKHLKRFWRWQRPLTKYISA